MRLQDKVCVVTGASSGIGKAMAAAFAAEGAAVVGFARRFEQQSLAQLPAPGQVAEIALDIADPEGIEARFAEISHVDVLVNNAGAMGVAPLWELAVEDLRAMLDTHVVGTFLCTRAALRSMRERRSGHIINIGSTAVRNSFPGSSGYAAAKSAQMAMSRVLREELREYDVRVTEFQPGATDTAVWDGTTGFDRSKMMKPEHLAELAVEIVCRPYLSVEDVLVLPPGGNL
jgi:NADP-dependent 3-hydroxy acid dehydrogenase YdfG